MNKLKYLIPLALLFITPWMHLALFRNLMMANPEIGAEGAHNTVWVSQFITGLITLFWAAGAFS